MAKKKRRRSKVIRTVETVATVKKTGNVLGTVLIVGGIGLAAYVITKAMPKLPEMPAWLGGDGGMNFAPVISLPSIGGTAPLQPTPYERAQEDFESRCRPTGLPWQDTAPVTPSEWDQFKDWWTGEIPQDEPIVTQQQPHIIQTVPLKAANIGGEVFWFVPQVPGVNMTTGEAIKEMFKMSLSGIGWLGGIFNALKFGSPFVEVVPDVDMVWPELQGEADAAPVCEGQACATASGFQPFFIPGGVGGEEPVKSEAPAKKTTTKTTTPTVYAPAAPAIGGIGGGPKDLYIL